MDMAARNDALETYWPYVCADERARFAGSVYFRDGAECWIWLGGIESDGGYTSFPALHSASSRRTAGR